MIHYALSTIVEINISSRNISSITLMYLILTIQYCWKPNPTGFWWKSKYCKYLVVMSNREFEDSLGNEKRTFGI